MALQRAHGVVLQLQSTRGLQMGAEVLANVGLSQHRISLIGQVSACVWRLARSDEWLSDKILLAETAVPTLYDIATIDRMQRLASGAATRRAEISFLLKSHCSGDEVVFASEDFHRSGMIAVRGLATCTASVHRHGGVGFVDGERFRATLGTHQSQSSVCNKAGIMDGEAVHGDPDEPRALDDVGRVKRKLWIAASRIMASGGGSDPSLDSQSPTSKLEE
ncbi:hypothetical protein LZ32DRAFT_652865 [Colletotrichum eremochloae]|nr:hypothetical protein LZ32DRAFT_652865 [Colletotrichum eremochloae]